MVHNSWNSNDVEHLMKKLDSKVEGLSQEDAETRLDRYGSTKLVENGGPTPMRIFRQRFINPTVLILVIAILIFLITSIIGIEYEVGRIIYAIVTSVIVVFNTVFSSVQEYKSQQDLDVLKQIVTPKTYAKALRSNGGYS